MDAPYVSVIIPTYRGTDHLGEAVESVLNQSYAHFELIVVDDASPDTTRHIVARFHDPRLRYVVHEVNQGAVAARRTGVNLSRGEIIFFLDQDDWFHPEKLRRHVAFLAQAPQVSITYNSRFEYEQASNSVRTVWQAPRSVSLADLVLGFPFSPSDTVLRREAALREELWEQSYVQLGDEMIFNGAEIIMGGRLALAGYQFASVGGALNYRRYHPRRTYRNIAARCRAEISCQAQILDDPRCPADVGALRSRAYENSYLVWAYYALAQSETELGRTFLHEATILNPALLEGNPVPLVEYLTTMAAADGSFDLQSHLARIIEQLPVKLAPLAPQFQLAAAQAYLAKGAQMIIWNDPAAGSAYLARATQLHASLDEQFVQGVTYELLGYQCEFGDTATQDRLQRLVELLTANGMAAIGRRLHASYAINQAFNHYSEGERTVARRQVLRAIANEPRYLLNRGVLSMFARSTVGRHLQRGTSCASPAESS